MRLEHGQVPGAREDYKAKDTNSEGKYCGHSVASMYELSTCGFSIARCLGQGRTTEAGYGGQLLQHDVMVAIAPARLVQQHRRSRRPTKQQIVTHQKKVDISTAASSSASRAGEPGANWAAAAAGQQSRTVPSRRRCSRWMPATSWTACRAMW